MPETLFQPVVQVALPFWVELIGYAAAAVMLIATFRATIIPLRTVSLLGNAIFLVFGLLIGLWPLVLAHALMLPVNLWRLVEMRRLVRAIRAEHEGEAYGMEALLPYMRMSRVPEGTVLFRKGDKADGMYLIGTGTVRLVEIDHALSDGAMVGEIAFFTPERARTVTAVAASDCALYALSNEAMLQLYYQNPKFGLYLMRVIAERLQRNWDQAEARAAGG